MLRRQDNFDIILNPDSCLVMVQPITKYYPMKIVRSIHKESFNFVDEHPIIIQIFTPCGDLYDEYRITAFEFINSSESVAGFLFAIEQDIEKYGILG